MAFVTIDDRIDRLEALFGQFMTEMLVLSKKSEERHKAAEAREKLAEQRHLAAETRSQTAEKLAEQRHLAAEARNQAAEERNQTAEKLAEQRHLAAEAREKLAEQRHLAAEARNQAAEERTARFEKEMAEFKDEMAEFKDEMGEFKDEMRASKRELDKKWGDLANKMGTIIEDILAPNLRRLATEHFHFPVIEDFMIRRARRAQGQETEFDTLVIGPDAVILGEAKSTPSLAYADEFAAKVKVFPDYFPELRGRRLIPVFGSWAIADSIVARLTTHGIYAMRMGEDTMELANAPELEKS